MRTIYAENLKITDSNSRFRLFIFSTNNKISNKISSAQITIAKTLSKVNIAVTGICEGPLDHQVE